MGPFISQNQDNSIKLKLSNGSTLDVDSKQHANLYEILRVYPDSLQLETTNSTVKVVIGEVGNKKNNETYHLILRNKEKLLNALEELVQLRLDGETPPTIGTNNLDLNFTVLPSDDKELFKLVKTANDIKFQLVVEEVGKENVTLGLRNTSGYKYEPIAETSKEDKIKYQKITNITELKFLVPIDKNKVTFIDGATTKALLDRVLDQDNQQASLNKDGGTASSKPNNRKTQFLTRLRTEGLISSLIENDDLIGLIQKATGTLHSDLIEAQAQSHQGLHYRFAAALTDILSKPQFTDNTISKADLASVALPTLSNIAKLYSQSPATFEILKQGVNLETEQGKVLYNQRLARVLNSLAANILSERKELSEKIVLNAESRVIGFCQDNTEIDPEKFKNCIQSKGVPEERILVFKNKSRILTEEQKLLIEKSVSNKQESAFIYLWSHGDQTGSTVVHMDDLVNSIVVGCPKVTMKNGLPGIDLSHVTVVFDHCLGGAGAEEFLNKLQAKTNQLGLDLINNPITLGVSQPKEFSKGSDISLFLEVLQALPLSEQKGLNVSDLLKVSDSMFQHSTNLVSSWQHAVDLQTVYQRRLMISSHTPLIFGTKSNSFNQLIESINKELSSEKDKSQPVLRLPKLLKDNRLWPHLSKNEIVMPKIITS